MAYGDTSAGVIKNKALYYLNAQDFYGIEDSLIYSMIGKSAKMVQSDVCSHIDEPAWISEDRISYAANARYIDLKTKLTQLINNKSVKEILRIFLLSINAEPSNNNLMTPLVYHDSIKEHLIQSNNQIIFYYKDEKGNEVSSLATYTYRLRMPFLLYLEPIPTKTEYLWVEYITWLDAPTKDDDIAWNTFAEFADLVALRLATEILIKRKGNITPLLQLYQSDFRQLVKNYQKIRYKRRKLI